MSARDELAPMQELDAHRPTHREYDGGWWELACTGCDFAKGGRLSHLDWAPHHAHREEIFRDALRAAGYRQPRTVNTAEELDALPFESVVRDAEGHVLERWGEPEENLWTTVMVNAFIRRGDIALPAAVLYEPEAAK